MRRALSFLLLFLTVVLGACGNKNAGPPAPTSADPAVQAGFKVSAKEGCFGCHQANGKGGKSGPTLDGLAGSQVQLDNGSTVTADDEHLRRALKDPDEQIRKGYPKGVMSAVMANSGDLSDAEVDQIVAYLKTLGTAG